MDGRWRLVTGIITSPRSYAITPTDSIIETYWAFFREGDNEGNEEGDYGEEDGTEFWLHDFGIYSVNSCLRS